MLTHLFLTAAAPDQQSAILTLMPFLLILMVFYFIMWRPIRKKQQDHQRFVSELKKGDKVVTNGGLYGEVVKVDADIVLLKLAENIKVRVAKRAVAGLEGSPEDKEGS